MKIERITPVVYRNNSVMNKNNKRNFSNNTANIDYSYNPISYKDYNIQFTARLFRTPANFFEQEFNKNGMPETMKNYLYEDFEDRQNMPPAQMMKFVFGDIKEAESLEDVKRNYPNEQLFNELKDSPNKKARTGILAEIDLMKQDDKSLFKNGQDNLGLYILKKIYVEGKSLKEINKDFDKDVSVYYKGLSPIKYETLSAFGIKFPNNAFWKSFTATREDFPYEYKPRKALAPRENFIDKHSDISKPRLGKKKFDKVKDWEIDKLADALIKGIGNEDEIKKQIKKRNIQDQETLSFVAKYLGEINSVVLEKVHASDEMKDFFANYDSLSQSQKNAFKAYWDSDPQIREHRSVAMKDTIKLFMDAYGEDGNNEDFHELLDYAHNIRPLRIEKQKEHAKLQAEYDEMFSLLEAEDDFGNEVLDVPVDKDTSIKSFSVSPETHEVKFNGNLDDAFIKLVKNSMNFVPEAFTRRYIKYLLSQQEIDNKYKLTMLLSGNIPEGYEDLFYTDKDIENISSKVNNRFTEKNTAVMVACNQAMAELLAEVKPNDAHRFLPLDTNELQSLAVAARIKNLSQEKEKLLDKVYQEYTKPITSKDDINKINAMLVDFISNYKKSVIYKEDSSFTYLFDLLQANLEANPALKKDLSKILKYSKFVENYGGTAKILLKNNISENMKKAKMELMFEDFMNYSIKEITPIFSDNIYNLETILKPYDYDAYAFFKREYLRKQKLN